MKEVTFVAAVFQEILIVVFLQFLKRKEVPNIFLDFAFQYLKEYLIGKHKELYIL